MKFTTKTLLAALMMATVASPLFAADKYWRLDGTSGTWTSTNWGTVPAGPFTTGWTAGDDATFNANSSITYVTGTNVGNVTVASGVTVTVTTAGTYNTGGNIRTMTIGAGGLLDMAGQNISTTAGTGFIKNGAGIWNMGANANNYGGGFTLNAGTVIVSGNSTFGGGVLTLNGGTIQSSGARTFTPSSIVLGGDFEITGTGGWTMNMDVGLGAATRTITNNATGTKTWNGIVSGGAGAGLNFAGTGTMVFTNASNSFSGPVTIDGSGVEVEFQSNGSLGTGSAITVDGGRIAFRGTFEVSSSRSFAVGDTAEVSTPGGSSVITYKGPLVNKTGDTGVLTKQGQGILELGGVSTYTGNTTINNGTIKLIDGSNRLPTATTMSLGQAASANLGILDLNGFNQEIAGLNSTAGTNATASKNTVTSATSATLTLGGAGSYSYSAGTAANSGVITGAITLVKNGAGTQTFGEANSYTGKTTINDGFIAGAGESIFGTNPGAFVADQITFNGGGFASTGTVNFSSNRGITLGASGGTFNTTGGNITFTNAVAGTSGGSLTKTGTGTLNMGSGDSTANTYNGLTIVSNGTLNLNKTAGTNAIGGSLQIDSGATVTNAASNQISDSATVTNNGTWTVGASNSEVIGLLAGTNASANIALGTGGTTLTTGTASNSSYDGTISGPSTASLVKQGTGKLTLTNSGSSFGAVSINAGTISVSDVANSGTNSPLGTGSGTSAIGLGSGGSTGTLEFTGPTDSTNRGLNIGAAGGRVDVTTASTVLSITGTASGSGSLAKLGDGTLILSAGNTFGGAGQSVNITAGTLRISNNSALGSTDNDITFTNNATLQTSAAVTSARTVNVNTGGGTIDTNGFSSSFSGQVTGVGAMTKTGAGTLTLSNASNNYSGGTVINGGTLSVASNSHLGNTSGGITFENSANLLTTAGITSARGVTLGGTGSGSGGGIDTGGSDSTFSGLITGTGDLAKRGNGTLTLSNAASNYTGVTTVEAGRIAIPISVPASGNGPLGHSSGGDLRVGSGSSDAEFVLTNSGTTFGRGITVQGGSGARRIGGTNTTGTVTYSGDISMSSGGGSANLIAANGGTVNITGVISGASASQDLSKAGTGVAGEGTVILSNANTYTGQTRVLNGTLQTNVNAPYGSNGAFGNATTNVLVGDTLANAHSAVLTIGVSGVTVGRDILATSPGLNTGTVTIGGSHASGTSTFAGALTLNRYVMLTASSSGTVHFTGTDGGLGGAINGSGGIEKIGGGTVELARAAGNTYSGGTTLTAGTLRVSNASGSATGTGAVVINGGTLTGGNAAGTVGFIAGPVTINTSGNIAPGSSPGILTTSGGVNFSGGSYLWELNALTTSGAGTNYDVILMTDGNLAISSGSLVPSFIGSATAPNIPNSFWDTARTWTVVDNTGTGTATGSLAIDNTAWSSIGLFTTAVSGNDLLLNWTPGGSEIPEPSSLLLVAAGGAMLMTRRRTSRDSIL